MLPEIKKILYTTDLGNDSRPVFLYAVRLARALQAKLHLLHVVEPLSSSDRQLIESYLSAEMKKPAEQMAEQFHENKVQKVLDTLKERVEQFCAQELHSTPDQLELIDGIDVMSGAPAEVIVREASTRDMDLIVAGSHARSTLHRVLLGSTTQKVTAMSSIPVLVVPIHGSETWER